MSTRPGPTRAAPPGDTQAGVLSVGSIDRSSRVLRRARANLRSERAGRVDGRSWPSGVPKRIDDPGRVQRLGRVLRLLRLIQERHGRWDLASLASELGCSTKTVQRDLLALEEAQIPFFYDKQRCCYAIQPGFRLSILDQPGDGTVEGVPGGSSPPAIPQPINPIELAESSRDQAERLLAEAERLIESLGRLCQSLRRSNPSGPATTDRGRSVMSTIGFGYGSEWHLLRYLGYHRADLNRAIGSAIPGGTVVEWLNSRFETDPAAINRDPPRFLDREIEGFEFLPAAGRQQLLPAWPRTGSLPCWDAVARIDVERRGGLADRRGQEPPRRTPEHLQGEGQGRRRRSRSDLRDLRGSAGRPRHHRRGRSLDEPLLSILQPGHLPSPARSDADPGPTALPLLRRRPVPIGARRRLPGYGGRVARRAGGDGPAHRLVGGESAGLARPPPYSCR